ncbi:hypothetical protein ABBQ32_003018 [Trebouxia sp. C0010 RCD-2024]
MPTTTGGPLYLFKRPTEEHLRPPKYELGLWSTGDCSQAGRMLQDSSSCHSAECITELAAGQVALGVLTGEVFLHDLRPDAAASTQPCATWWNGHRGCVSEMKYCPHQATLYALQESYVTRSTSYLQKWDAECGRAVAEACEFMEDWDLSCFCVTDQDSGGNEVIAGAVSEPCRGCSETALPTLCCHKSAAKAASLCVFDTRAGVSMVQRYSIHHGSLYPVMPCARGNYLFTSHFGTPLAVWDKRQMSHVVYEEEYLGNFPKPETFSEADLPLALPTSAVSHQGLCLSTDGDQLVGRAENGMVWLWDLSSCLGWQQGGPAGSWLQDTQATRMAAQQSQTQYQAGFEQRWPEMLGSIAPGSDGLVDIDLKNGRTCPIIASSGTENTESIVCLYLPTTSKHVVAMDAPNGN